MAGKITESRFWIDLLKKVLKGILKRKGFVETTSSKNQHVVPHEEGWAVKGAGNERYTAVYDEQEDAIERARTIAINYKSSVIIHRRDGSIRDRRSYK
jgi:uncharacterized protein YdaT